MIAPMRKVAAIAAARDADALVQRLFEAGVLHVSSVPQDSGAADLAAAKTELDGMDQAIGLLVSAQGKQQSIATVRTLTHEAALALAEEVRLLAQNATEADRARASVDAEIQSQEPYGDFDPTVIAGLQKSGVHVALLTFPKGATPTLPQGASLHGLSESSGMVAAAVISREPVSQELRPATLPVRRLSVAKAERDEHVATMSRVQARRACSRRRARRLAAGAREPRTDGTGRRARGLRPRGDGGRAAQVARRPAGRVADFRSDVG